MTVIDTYGGVIRPLLSAFDPVRDEVRLHTTTDGLSADVIDPSNVAALDLFVPAAGFEDYAHEHTGPHGVSLPVLNHLLSYARKGRGNADGDPVRLSINGNDSVDVTIDREDGPTRDATLFLIDPDSIPKDAQIPDKDELGGDNGVCISTHVTADVSEFADAVVHAEKDAEMVRFEAGGGDFIINPMQKDGAQPDDSFTFPGGANPYEPEGFGEPHSTQDGSIYTLDYLKDIAKAGDSAGMDHLAIWFGEETPTYLKYEDTDTGARATYCLSPRIESN